MSEIRERLRTERDALEDEATELRTDNETLAADVMRLRERVEELEERIVDMALTPDQEHVEATLAEYGITESTLGISTYRSLARALTGQEEDANGDV